MLDHDPRPGHRQLDWRELDAILCEHLPGWGDVERAWRPSASAFIYRNSGEELIGQGGWRAYVIVDRAVAIPEVGAQIYQTLWHAGHGYVQVSQSGLALDRTLVDAAVWQPERLDFAAPPVLGEGLVRRAPTTAILPGRPVLRTAGLRAELPTAEWRTTSPVIRAALAAVRGEIGRARATYIEKRTAEFRRSSGATVEQVKAVIKRAIEHSCLGQNSSCGRQKAAR
jgi:hypothetical protein